MKEDHFKSAKVVNRKYQTVEDERLKQALMSQMNFDGSSDNDDGDDE